MTTTCRIVHVEDSPDDAELVILALRGAPFTHSITRVETEPDYLAQLEAGVPDAILCDYHLPRFSAERALAILGERGLDIPFIVVSNHIGQDAAVIAMQNGAADYLSKSSMGRLAKAIASAIERRDARRERLRAVEALRRSEAMRRGILDSLVSHLALLDGTGLVLAVNKAWDEFDTARTAMAVATPRPGANYLAVLDNLAGAGGGFACDLARGIRSVISRENRSFSMEYQLDVGAAPHWYHARVMPLDGSDNGAVVSHLEVTDRVVAHLALQDAHRRMQALSGRVLAVQEEERRLISRELHDDVGQTLGALKIGLHRLSRGGPGEGAPGLMAECLAAADAALEKLRHLSHELRPPQLDQLGLDEALRWLAERQRAATGIEIHFKCAGLGQRRPPAALESACYRIVQEALSNATRHAKASCLHVSLDSDGRLLKLSVRDDGIGFDEAAARERVLKSGSLGLVSMEERAQLAGGRLKIRSVAGSGTTVSAIFPLPQVAGVQAPRSAAAAA